MARISRRERRLLRKTKPILPKKKAPEKQARVLVAPKKYTGLRKIYVEKYKTLLLIPFILLFISLILIAAKFAHTGDFMNRGISLKGGVSISFPEEELQVLELSSFLSSMFPSRDIRVRAISELGEQKGIIVESSDIEETLLLDALEQKVPGIRDISSVEIIGSSLGAAFFKQTLWAIAIAFVCMAAVVFYFFRSLVPGIAVILAAASDMIISLAIVNLLGFTINTAGIAAFLMLIGYSVDTNVLLSTNVLKRKEGSVMDRIFRSFKTGLTMSLTTISALVVAAVFTQSEVIKQIMLILIIGLAVDLMNTWIQNAGILRWYLEKKK